VIVLRIKTAATVSRLGEERRGEDWLDANEMLIDPDVSRIGLD